MDESIQQSVARLLGREPRGLEAVEVYNASREPAVIRVSSLVDDQPFPTLFWLVDTNINYRLDQLEAAGVIRQLQAEVNGNEDLQRALMRDHRRYIALRAEHMSSEIKRRLVLLGYYDALQDRGIGGIADHRRIRCLHTHYAAHLVEPNTIGSLLDQRYLVDSVC